MSVSFLGWTWSDGRTRLEPLGKPVEVKGEQDPGSAPIFIVSCTDAVRLDDLAKSAMAQMADAEASWDAMESARLAEELAALIERAKAEAAARPDAGRIGLPVVPDPKSPQPPPSGTFHGRYKTRGGTEVFIDGDEVYCGMASFPLSKWDACGNHVSHPAADLVRRIRDGEEQ